MDATRSIAELEREIKYNRDNRDYDLFLDGEYVGSAANYSDGEKKLNELVFAALTHGAALDQVEELFARELAPLQARLEAAIAELQR